MKCLENHQRIHRVSWLKCLDFQIKYPSRDTFPSNYYFSTFKACKLEDLETPRADHTNVHADVNKDHCKFFILVCASKLHALLYNLETNSWMFHFYLRIYRTCRFIVLIIKRCCMQSLYFISWVSYCTLCEHSIPLWRCRQKISFKYWIPAASAVKRNTF